MLLYYFADFLKEITLNFSSKKIESVAKFLYFPKMITYNFLKLFYMLSASQMKIL